MTDRTFHVGAGLSALPPVERHAIDPTLHRLQWNESPLEYPAALKHEVAQRLLQADWARYPLTLRPFALIDRLAGALGVDANQVVVSAGSSDMIRVVLGALLRQGDPVVMPSPTFLLYKRTARLLEAAIHEVPCSPGNDFALPIEALIESARVCSARAVVLCAPNNPTGTVTPLLALAALASNCGCALVIDEAYLEFSGQDLLPLAQAHPNVILIRTFSKAFRMAGVRVGYAVAHPSVAAELQKAVTSFPISIFQETAALVALDHPGEFAAGVAQVIAERERLAAALRALPGVRVFSSGTNFLLVQPPIPARALFDHLLHAHRVLVSDAGGYPELENTLRISIGTAEQNDLVIRGFRERIEGGV